MHEPVSFVNAPMLARERGLTVSEMRSTVSQDYVSLISLRAETDDGPVSVAGTLVGKRDAQRVMQVNDFDIEMAPAEHMVFFTYEDRPGIIGTVGTILGEHDVNIATMDVGRKAERGEALDVPHRRRAGPGRTCSTHIASEIDASSVARDHAARRRPAPERSRATLARS